MTPTDIPINGTRNALQSWFDGAVAKDPDLHKQLIAAPQTTLASLFGKAVPVGVKVVVVDESPNDLYLVNRFAGAMEPPEQTSTPAVQLSRSLKAISLNEVGFWEAMKANPKAQLAQRVGLNLAPQVTVHAVEEDADTFYLVLHYPAHYGAWTPPAGLPLLRPHPLPA